MKRVKLSRHDETEIAGLAGKIDQEWKIQISNLKQAENSLFSGLVEESLPFVVKVQGMNPCLKNWQLEVPAFICYIKIRSKE